MHSSGSQLTCHLRGHAVSMHQSNKKQAQFLISFEYFCLILHPLKAGIEQKRYSFSNQLELISTTQQPNSDQPRYSLTRTDIFSQWSYTPH